MSNNPIQSNLISCGSSRAVAAAVGGGAEARDFEVCGQRMGCGSWDVLV